MTSAVISGFSNSGGFHGFGGHSDRELRAAAGMIASDNLTAECAEKAFCDRQPEAGTSGRCSGGAVELAEDPSLLALGDALAMIADDELDALVVARHRQFDRRLRGGVSGGIVKDVREHLL